MKRARSAAVAAVEAAVSGSQKRLGRKTEPATSVTTPKAVTTVKAAPPTAPKGGRCWLMKTEPDVFSIDDLRSEGTTRWDGVRNYEARNHMRAMTVGDRVLVYHSNNGAPAVVGLGSIARTAYSDPTALDPKSEYYDPKADDTRWSAVDVAYVAALCKSVSLKRIQAMPALGEMALVRRGRLSVQPVEEAEYKAVVAEGGGAAPADATPIPTAKKGSQKKDKAAKK